jgi:hypothetical protein
MIAVQNRKSGALLRAIWRFNRILFSETNASDKFMLALHNNRGDFTRHGAIGAKVFLGLPAHPIAFILAEFVVLFVI